MNKPDYINEPLPQLPEWTSVLERGPTKADADRDGEVLWMTKDGRIFTRRWDCAFDCEVWWMPCADIAALPKRPVPEPKALPGPTDRIDAKEFDKAVASIHQIRGRVLTPDERETFYHGWQKGKFGS